jgi:enterochelin esterase-like enzyme
MKRIAAMGMALALLATGWYGAWSYAHNYDLYRGFDVPHDPKGVASGQLLTEQFYSPSLGAQRSYLIFLPPGYQAAAARGVRFPVLYLLHGAPGRPQLFIDAAGVGVQVDTLLAQRKIKPFLIVMPDGRVGGWLNDTEWANARKGPFEKFVLDAVKAVDARWATKADRTHRTIAGLSEGAYGAVNISLHHPNVFANFQSWSGYYIQTPTGPFHGLPRATLVANSPALYVDRLKPLLKRYPVHAFLYGGTKDKVTPELRAFAPRLAAAGARVTVAIYPGRHDWRMWRGELPHALTWASRAMAH